MFLEVLFDSLKLTCIVKLEEDWLVDLQVGDASVTAVLHYLNVLEPLALLPVEKIKNFLEFIQS